MASGVARVETYHHDTAGLPKHASSTLQFMDQIRQLDTLDPQPRCDVRLALLAVQCLETAMPYGGTIRVDRPGPGWSVTGEAERLVLDPALWSGLTDPGIQAEITPALVQFGLMPMAVVDAGRHLEVTTSGQRIEMTF